MYIIKEEDIVFVTTTLYTKWLSYQSEIIKKLFPKSQHIIVDGRGNWPYPWFYWIEEIKKIEGKYFIHIDEDFFITSKDELLKVISKMESNNIDLMGVPDGGHVYRGTNPIAMNTFLLIGKIDKLKDIDFKNINITFTNNGWENNYNLKFKEEYKNDWTYSSNLNNSFNFDYEQEPYYAFMWKMKDLGCKFDYLYPSFDDRFKSTNPRLSVDSEDIGIHMWYTRCWDSTMDVLGMPNNKRYEEIEKFLNN